MKKEQRELVQLVDRGGSMKIIFEKALTSKIKDTYVFDVKYNKNTGFVWHEEHASNMSWSVSDDEDVYTIYRGYGQRDIWGRYRKLTQKDIKNMIERRHFECQ